MNGGKTSLIICLLLVAALLFGCQEAIDAGEKDYAVKDNTNFTPEKKDEGKPEPKPEPPKVASVCGNGKLEGAEQCDIGGNKTAIFKDACPLGRSCQNCKCTRRMITPRCGDGYISDSAHGGDEECDIGGDRYAPDENSDGIPDSYPDPCKQPKECIGCKCQVPTPRVLEDCNGDDYPPEVAGRYSFIKGIQGGFSQRKYSNWGDSWCAPTSASYSFRYWFGRGFTKFLDQYRENETKKEWADENNDSVVTDGEATEQMAQELGEIMKTNPENGTYLDEFVKGLEKFINQSGYGGKFIIKKYGTALGESREPTYSDYKRELEACEDVLVGIRYPRPPGGGHAMVGKSSSSKSNKDGSYNISLMDPWTGKEYHTKMWENGTLEYDGYNVTMYRIIAVSPVTPAITMCGDMSMQRPNSQGVFEECEKGVDICPAGSACNYDTCKCVSTVLEKTFCGDGMIQWPNSNAVYEECEKSIGCKGSGLVCDEERCACVPDCGDGECVTGETYSLCPEDCPPVCGDGVCQPEENNTGCPSDCVEGPLCGNGVIEGYEQCENGIPCAETQECNMDTCLCETLDRDHDGYPDYSDNCPDTPNSQSDMDGDNVGDPCDAVPVDCPTYCNSIGYSSVAAEDVTSAVCDGLKGAPPIECMTVCSYVYYASWDWEVSDYSCCCKQVKTYECSDCPGENPQCPDCPETWP